MPYIVSERRKQLHFTGALNTYVPTTAGELNYVITKMVLRYLARYATDSYSNFNEAVGVLECVKQEFYRRAVVPYEDAKIIVNGDVPGYA